LPCGVVERVPLYCDLHNRKKMDTTGSAKQKGVMPAEATALRSRYYAVRRSISASGGRRYLNQEW
jgi:hypothetical protein